MSTTSTVEGDSQRHKALMDKMYAAQRHIYDVTRAYYLLGRDHLIANLDPPKAAHVLEVGCGTGRNIIKAARAYPDAHFYGIDISDEMLRTATTKITSHDLVRRIQLAQADAVTFSTSKIFGSRKFDRIYFSYTLSMIPDWQGALRNASGMLAADGEIHIVDFGQLEHLPKIAKSTLLRWLQLFHVTPRADLQSLDMPTLETTAFDPLFKGYAWHLRMRPRNLPSANSS
jgi:S-adenosylmethionine-diacylgycerolhomoserine-N-methlytransferase